MGWSVTSRRTTQVIGHMVVRNECDRYLDPVLARLQRQTDLLCVCDDQSDDGTYEHLRAQKIPVRRRPNGVPSFTDHEGEFRSWAWTQAAVPYSRIDSTWVLSLDADEFLVCSDPADDARTVLSDLIETALAAGHSAMTFPVAEVFAWDDYPMIRTDGFWGKITATRFARWQKDPTFSNRRDGCGSLPVMCLDNVGFTDQLTILHLGYATEADRVARHQRYQNARGHHPSHIASILQPPTLVRWAGECPSS